MDPFSRQKPGQCEPQQASGPKFQTDQVGDSSEPADTTPSYLESLIGWLTQVVGQGEPGSSSSNSSNATTSTTLSSLTSAVSHHYSTLASITDEAVAAATAASTEPSVANSTLYLQMETAQQEQIIQSAASGLNGLASEFPFQLEALDGHWQLFLALLYSLTAIISFVLNVVTVIVLARCGRSELRKYLINLSMSDLMMSCFSILTLSVFVSAATMTVIGLNREKKCSKLLRWKLRKTHVILTIWLIGIVISTPEYLMFGVEPFCYEGHRYNECRQLWPDNISHPYTVFIYLFTFLIPLSLMTYLYACIGLKLWRRRMPGNVDANRDLTMQTMRVKVIKMLFVVVVAFGASWLPLQTFSMVLHIYPGVRENIEYRSLSYNIFVCTYFISHWLSMAHSCLNPLIYCFMNDKFRTDLHSLICKRDKYQLASQPRQSTQLTAGHLHQHQHHKNQSCHQHQARPGGAIAMQVRAPAPAAEVPRRLAGSRADGATTRAHQPTGPRRQRPETSASGGGGGARPEEPEVAPNLDQWFELKRQVGETLFVKVMPQQQQQQRPKPAEEPPADAAVQL